jgi:hypothetical protein
MFGAVSAARGVTSSSPICPWSKFYADLTVDGVFGGTKAMYIAGSNLGLACMLVLLNCRDGAQAQTRLTMQSNGSLLLEDRAQLDKLQAQLHELQLVQQSYLVLSTARDSNGR